MADNAENVNKAIESLRRRLCNDEEAWRDLCVVMGALSPAAAGPQGVVGDEMAFDAYAAMERVMANHRGRPECGRLMVRALTAALHPPTKEGQP